MTREEIYNKVFRHVDITRSAFDMAICDYENTHEEFLIYEFIEWLDEEENSRREEGEIKP